MENVQTAQVAMLVTVPISLSRSRQQMNQAVLDAIGRIGHDGDVKMSAAQAQEELERPKGSLLEELPEENPIDVRIFLQDLLGAFEHDQRPNLCLGKTLAQGP
jgi:hypothetical protein